MPHIKSPRFRLDGIKKSDRELLEYLRLEFRRVYNHYLRIIRETGILSKIRLEKKTTITAKRRNVSYPIRSELLANTRQCARDKAVECVKLYHSLRERNIKTDFPEFMYETINPRLNWRDGYRINPDKSVRISVKKDKLVHAKLDGSRDDLEIIDKAFNNAYKFNSAEIVKEGDDYFICVNLTPNQECLQ
ncbi:MAG: hypothetical protein DRO89_03185 [Candidatus Altiarchaeales archaeon]|nr:MAG: hypothetical protein DRO89_03185 [Candidatus Altiarchaeales archaeon]